MESFKSLNGTYFVPQLKCLVVLTFVPGFDSFYAYIPKDQSDTWLPKEEVNACVNKGLYYKATEVEKVLYG